MVEKGTALLRKMEINVAEAEKRTGKNTVNMQETYTVYLIETRWVSAPLLPVDCDMMSVTGLCKMTGWWWHSRGSTHTDHQCYNDSKQLLS